MFIREILLVFFYLSSPFRNETLTAYAGETDWLILEEIDGLPVRAQMMLDLSRPGRVSGSGPCGVFNGDITVPYPWFGIADFWHVTSGSCQRDDRAAQARFFAVFTRMAFAEIAGDVLILSNAEGEEMVFRRYPPD